jgi:hypothetical protein
VIALGGQHSWRLAAAIAFVYVAAVLYKAQRAILMALKS